MLFQAKLYLENVSGWRISFALKNSKAVGGLRNRISLELIVLF